jgi:hypothetical protein
MAKTKRYLKLLSYVPYLRDQSWGQGFNWGFENFQNLATNPQYKFDLATVGQLLVGIPDEAVQAMEEFGLNFMPDVPSWGANTPNPYDDPPEDNAA